MAARTSTAARGPEGITVDVQTGPAPLASFGDIGITGDHALLELLVSGRWTEVRAEMRAGLAPASSAVGEPTRDEVKSAEVAFRQARRLLAADDLKSWLAERSLSVADWRGHLARALQAQRYQATASNTTQEVQDGDDVDDAELSASARIAIVVEGTFESAVGRLLEGAAAADLEHDAGTSFEPCPDSDAEALARSAASDNALPLQVRDVSSLTNMAATVLDWTGARQRAFEGADPRHVRELLAERRLDWTQLEFDELVLSSATAAREAVMCVRADGLDLAAVGALAEVPVRTRSCTAEEAGEASAPHLLAAEPGAALGPIEEAGAWRVLVLRERLVPNADDPAVWARARAQVVSEQLHRRLAGKVRFHAPI